MSNLCDKIAHEMLKPMHKRDVLILSTYTSLWGIWVFNPLWDTFSRSHIYEKLQYICPEWTWGLLAILIGVISAWAVLKDRLYILGWMSKIGAVVWFVISLLYFTTDYSSTAWITAFMVTSFYSLKAMNIAINKNNAFVK